MTLDEVPQGTTRREPRQDRSRAKVSRILAAASSIIEEQGIEALNTVAVAEQAGVAVGTLYQYFANIDAIVDALVDHHLSIEIDFFDEVLSGGEFSSTAEAILALFNHTVDYFRTESGFERLWHSPLFSARHRARERDVDLNAMRFAGRRLVLLGLLEEFDESVELDLIILWTQIAALVELAFREDERGDERILERIRQIIRLQLPGPARQAGPCQ